MVQDAATKFFESSFLGPGFIQCLKKAIKLHSMKGTPPALGARSRLIPTQDSLKVWEKGLGVSDISFVARGNVRFWSRLQANPKP